MGDWAQPGLSLFTAARFLVRSVRALINKTGRSTSRLKVEIRTARVAINVEYEHRETHGP